MKKVMDITARMCVALLSACFVVLCVTGCAPKNEFAPPPPPTVQVQIPEVRDVTTYIDFTGTLKAPEVVDVRARVQGFLKSVDFTAGQMVKKGDMLFQIEEDQYQAAVVAAQGAVERAKASLKLAKATASRQRQLYVQHAISELELIDAQSQESSAQGALEEAEANLSNAQLNLSYTKIVSGIDGRISRNLADAGNLVGAGDFTLLATVVNDDPMYAYFKVNERTILAALEMKRQLVKDNPDAKLELDVVLELADDSRYGLPGKVDYFDNEVDARTGLIELRAVFANPNHDLLPGLFAKIRFPQENKGALLIPASAVQRDLGGNFVLVVGSDGVVEQRYVTLGDIVENRVQIVKEGLKAEETIVVSGLQRARPGSTVNPKTVESKGA